MKLIPYIGNQYALVKILLYGLAAALILISSYLALRNREEMVVVNEKYLNMFRLSAGIYIGTFILGNNWDYRLMFLLFAIPQITSWAEEKSSEN
jgi:hypothetical protein